MIILRIIILSVIMHLCLNVATATGINHSYDNLRFLNIDESKGLSQNNVRAITKDKYGFIWIGTKNGLNRFDGNKLSEIECVDADNGKSARTISALFSAHNGDLWIGTDSGLFILDSKTGKMRFLNRKDKYGNTINSWVSEISGHNDDVWISVPNQGIFRYSNDSLQHYDLKNTLTGKSDQPSHMGVGSDGKVWVGTWGNGVYLYDENNREFTHLTSDSNGNILTDLKISGLSVIGDDIFLSTQEGDIYEFSPTRNLLTRRWTLPSIVRALSPYKEGLLAGTYEGVYYLDCHTGKATHYQHDPLDRFSLQDNIIYSIYCDDEGDVWIGTMFGGVSYHLKEMPGFEKVRIQDTASQLISPDCIRGLSINNNNNIWIGTENRGLVVFNPEDGRYRGVGDSNNTVLDIFTHNNQVFVGLFDKGLLIVDKDGVVRRYSGDLLGIRDSSVFSFFIDSSGERWIGNGKGLFRAPENSLTFTAVKGFEDKWIHDITQDNDGRLLIATMGNGAWYIDKEQNVVGKFPLCKPGDGPIENLSVSSITTARNGDILFSTDGEGLFLYSPSSDVVRTFDMDNGLPDNIVYKVVEDRNGILWFGTNKGLVGLDPDSSSMRVFTTKSCLPENQFNYASSVVDSLGNIYMGTVKGLTRFNPESVEPIPDYINKIYLTGMAIDGEKAGVGEKGSPVLSNILETTTLTLQPDQSNVSFEIGMPNLFEAGLNRYYYKLQPLDKEWIPVREGVISFSRLNSGTYDLVIKGVDAFGREVENSLRIKVLTPWYRTVWAILIYVSLGTVAVFICLRLYLRHKAKQLEEEQHIAATRHEVEMYKSKVDFFTEIAHEIRTPLTLISAPIESMKNPGISPSDMQYNLKLLDRNTNRLLELVTQLLNFQKLSKKRYELKITRVDISKLVSETVERFMPEALRKNIDLNIIRAESIKGEIDCEAFTKILSNLLTNGLKYAHSKVEVSLTGDTPNRICVNVFSDGDVIEGIQRERIFEVFYRMPDNKENAEGIGLGLPLARLLAELHGGTLSVIPAKEGGNTFCLHLPAIGIEDNVENRPSDGEPLGESAHTSVQTETATPDGLLTYQVADNSQPIKRYRILIVEDNVDMRDFISHNLSDAYDISCAENGLKGIEVIKNENIDLIVSDVMMPVMDGLDMCMQIKANTEYCHIPIIFLTAKNDTNIKIQGLSCGAEAFIEKPFSIHHLKSQIFSLLDNRRREREKYIRQPFYSLDSVPANKLDEDFIERATEYVLQHISEEELNVEKMGEALCFSRSAFYRKIKQVFGVTPVEFIRSIRLKKAAELISTHQYKVYEICYMVGISSPSYFSKVFQKQFGMSPKEFESKY